ncbi:MAG: terminase large subunit [Armatimonadia bacterium]|nr:terminase large subunit [Armatimonadia bacterium]
MPAAPTSTRRANRASRSSLADRRAPKVSQRWRRLFKRLPGYDPIAMAAPGQWFDEQAANYAVGFYPACLKHVKGTCAGEPFNLEDWEKAIIGAAFGWKNSDGNRRFRTVFIYVPKKNGKTALVAGTVLFVLTQDDELGAEIYSAAASRDQAALVFQHASGMVRLQPELDNRLRVYGAKGGGQQRSIHFHETMSFYRCLAADDDTADGTQPHFIAVDELHRHRDGALMDILWKGTSSRRNPMMMVITTADHDRPSACNEMYEYACRVRDNGGDPSKPGYDPAFLPVIYEAAEDDDWRDPDVWAKANPNLGVSKSLEYMESECRRAEEDPTRLNGFLRFELNRRTQETESLFDLDAWDKCPGKIIEADLLSRPCFAGLDLSQRDDISSFCLVWPPPPDEDDGIWTALWRMWCPEAKLVERKSRAIPYHVWADQGWIELTDGNDIDYDVIEERIVEDSGRWSLQATGYDPYNATNLTSRLINVHGLEMVPMRQGAQTLSEPTKAVKGIVSAHRLNHGGNPVARWHAGNAVGKTDSNDNVVPVKNRSKDKIDGMSALIMAVGRALTTEPAQIPRIRAL